MYRRLLIFKTKVLMKLLRLMGKNGSALPGLIIEKLYPNFLYKVLKSSEKKIILVTGTNGKTTTTKMLVAGLRASGLNIVTNSTGSNMTRGLIAALIEDMTYFGSLRPTDWFVFEMDEAYAPIFTAQLSPRLLVGLNVLRDQLDRYGEIDTTAKLIEKTALKCDNFVYSALDPLLASVAEALSAKNRPVFSFGVSKTLLPQVMNEQSTHGSQVVQLKPDFVLESAVESNISQKLKIIYDSQKVVMGIPVKGFHNALNALAAYGTLTQLLPSEVALRQALSGVTKMPTPFGRGERLQINGKNITVALVKNPSGFATNLTTFVEQTKPDVVLFVVNDQFADGRDVSWLWDVDFSSKIPTNTTLYVSGIRRFDMALRLKHDGLEARVETTVTGLIDKILKSKHKNIVIIPTYTALFEVRSALAKHGKVPRIW